MARLPVLAKLLIAAAAIGALAGATVGRERGEAPFRPRPAMTFERVEADGVAWVAASGRIADETPDAFARFLAQHDLTGHTLYLDSFGGRLTAAMRLGRMFRAAGLSVSVGRTLAGPQGPVLVTHSVACNSACVYALMGGVQRRVGASVRLGVHQFSSRQNRTGHVIDPAHGLDEFRFAQLQTARLAVYMQEMGIDLRLLEVMHSVPHGAPLRILADDEIEEMRLADVEPTAAPTQSVGWLVFTRRDDPMLYTRGAFAAGDRRVGHELALRCGQGADHDLTFRSTHEAASRHEVAVNLRHVRFSATRSAHVWSAPPDRPMRFAGARVSAWLYARVPRAVIAEAHETGRLGVEVLSEIGSGFGPRQEIAGPGFAAASGRFLEACADLERAAAIR